MDIVEKQSKYNECVERILLNKKTILKSAWNIGLDLRTIKEKELFLLECRDFKQFLKERVSIGRSTAYFLIDIVTEYEKTDFEKWGFRKLIIIKNTIEDEKDRRQFIIKEPVYSVRHLPGEVINYKISKGIKNITRFKEQAGKPPHYPHTEAEAERKLIRQFDEIRSHSEQFRQFKENFTIELTNWMSSAKKFKTEEVYKLREEADSMLKEI